MTGNERVVHYIFEAGILARTPRSGFPLLSNSGQKSVAEHINRVLYIVYALCQDEKNINREKVLLMALFHDFAEARTGDHNYINKKYSERKEDAAVADMASGLPFGAEVVSLFTEYEDRQTRESIIVKDADVLELICFLKEEMDRGNQRAETWLPYNLKFLRTTAAKQLAKSILETYHDSWWRDDPHDQRSIHAALDQLNQEETDQ